MDFIDEQHVPLFKVGEDGGQIAGTLDHRPGGAPHVDSQLVADNRGQRSLAQTRVAVEKHMIEGLSPLFGGFNEHRKIFFDGGLTDILIQPLRSEAVFDGKVFIHRFRFNYPIIHLLLPVFPEYSGSKIL